MRKLVLAILLVVLLLSLFAGVAFATCPEYEDKGGSGNGHGRRSWNAAPGQEQASVVATVSASSA